MLSSVDKMLHGAETGKLSKAEVREALDAFFLVGQPNGKTVNRLDGIMQVLSQNPALQLILQPSSAVHPVSPEDRCMLPFIVHVQSGVTCNCTCRRWMRTREEAL